MISWEMFKFLIKNIIYVFSLLVFMLIGFSYSYTYDFPLWNYISDLRYKIERNIKVNNLVWDPIIKDLYSNSFSIVKDDVLDVFINSLDKTVDDLNLEHSCSLSNQDVLNILYKANSYVRRQLKANFWIFEEPTDDSMQKSCQKFNKCRWKSTDINPTLIGDCLMKLEDKFFDYYNNASYLSNLWSSSKWSEFFWNYSLDDSSYDIINDIYVLGKILFWEVIEPNKTLFFKMPHVDYQAGFQEPNMNMNVDWFSPYNDVQDDWSQNSNEWENDNETNGDFKNWSVGDKDLAWETLWDDVKSFIDQKNIKPSNPWFSLWGNSCVSWFDFDWTLLDEEISQNADNQNNTWDNDDATTGTSWDWDDDWDDDWDEADMQWLKDYLDSLWVQASWDFNDYPQTLWCIQTCDLLPCNAMSCDKAICYAKCLCQHIESPDFDPNVNPWLTSVFKLDICIVPVLQNEFLDNKVVYNISEIFTALYNVLQNLKNSWQMATSTKTTEFIDTSFKELDFSEQMAFAISTNTKAPVVRKSQLTASEEQIKLNKSLMENILKFSHTKNLDQEINKYVVMDDPCKYENEKQKNSDAEVSQNEDIWKNCYNKYKNLFDVSDVDLDLDLSREKFMQVNDQISNFLDSNLDFWYQVSQMFDSFSAAATSLRNK